MSEYKLRYPENDLKQDAYENACDCITCGLGMTAWKFYGLSIEQRCKVWGEAAKDIGNLSMV